MEPALRAYGFRPENSQKYSVNQHLIETILAWITSKEIAIPEIQRPFVWDAVKVRDLLDSLYKGFPVGYIISWKNPDVRLKDGSRSQGKRILIDGQQRVTALQAAILGHPVINTDYESTRIRIAFHPIEQRFEVLNPAIMKDRAWIPDISAIFGAATLIPLVRAYQQANPESDEVQVETALADLKAVTKKQIGLIELDADLDIETVTEIFIRINSKGVVLSQADFAMSKIAANESYGGSVLRKCIDYFCNMAVKPEFYAQISQADAEFTKSEYMPKIAWLRNENDDIYDPDYGDLLRVAFTSEFGRGKIADLVSLLSGRNFESRSFEEAIAETSFARLKKGVFNFINETNFKRFIMIVKSAGFVTPDLVRSQGALNFAYVVFLKLRSEKVQDGLTETFVRKWLVLSLLTGRYSGSPESMFDFDIRSIDTRTFPEHLKAIEAAELSEAFWTAGLVQDLDTSSSNIPGFNVYLAALCKANNNGFLSRDINVKELLEHKGDIHHIFPKDYLKKNGLSKRQYNQVANYTVMQSEINVKIGNKAPKVYFDELRQQCQNGTPKYGGIANETDLFKNLEQNDIPESVFDMDVAAYPAFLEQRRKRMAERIRRYYESL